MRVRVLLAAFLGFAPVSASAFDCVSVSVGMAPYLCGDTFSRVTSQGSAGGNATVNGVTFQNLIGGAADNFSTGDGGMSGVARVEADWGKLHAFASSDNGQFDTYAPPEDSESRVVSNAAAAFADIVTLTSSTLPVGTAVAITVTMGVDGGFSASGSGGQAWLTYSKMSNFPGFYMEKQAILSANTHSVPPPFALENYFVGDQLIFKFAMRAIANTSNKTSPVVAMSAADMEGTGTLLIEVTTPGVTLEAVSGHDYTTVPEPARAMLLAAAALAVVGRGLASRRTREAT